MIGRFVVWAAVGALTVPFAAAAQPQDAASAPLKIEDFTRDPALSQPKISPDGTHLAWIEDNTLYIFDTRDQTAKHASGGKYPMAGLDWIDNDDLAVYPEQLTRKQLIARPKYRFSPLVVSKEARIVRPLMARPDGKVWPEDMTPIVRYVTTPVPATVTFTDERVYTVEVATGKRTVTATLIRGDWHFFDAKGTERVAVDFNDSKVSYGFTGATVRYRDASGTVQTLKLPRQDKDNIYYTDFDYAADDNGLYWSQFDYKAGIASIYRFDLATGAKTLFRTTAEKNTGIVLNAKGKVVGVSTESDRLHVDWTDPYYKTMMEAVQKLFPEAEVAITDMSDDGGKVVFLISGPQQPDTYYIYDAQSRHLDEIGTNYPELEGQVLAPMTYVTYKARDGLDIPAYVTKFKDTPVDAPLIVLAHGGPAARDDYGFDYQAQYFAHRGYVVLQPQYRGSRGFGDAFERAGNRHLAQMTTDLEDGVHYLAAQHMIDPAKVCVVGWSWGGYLAQAGLAFAPDTYVCGISGDGVSDLIESINEDDYWGGHVSSYWRDVIGRPWSDGDQIRAVSPIDHVDAIKAPLLLIHGKADDVVDIRQSDRMNAAMKRAGKDVTYIAVTDMPHGPDTPEDRLALLKDMDAFIAKAFAKGK